MKLPPRITTAAAVALVIGGAFYFEPWTLFTSSSVDEAIPEIQAEEDAQVETDVENELRAYSVEIEPEPIIEYPITLAQGELISHEHETSGQALILELEDGSRVLRLEDLITSDGPQLEVWITDAPVIEGLDGWFVFDDGKYESLGGLKATQGNQNYELPADLNLEEFSSVSIWCSRFAVSFGAASLL